MSQFHTLFQDAGSSRQGKEEDSTVKTASAVSEAIFQHELTPRQKKVAGPLVHYGFGTSVATFYAVAAETQPSLRTGWGTGFGTAVWLGAHVIAVPLLGLSKPVTRSTPRREGVELGAHLVYGAVIESVRRLLANGAR
jgi:uncharacterized membrane protein YagU involved in acid resistance